MSETSERSASDPHASFRVAPTSRWLHVVTLGLLVAMSATMAAATGWSWMIAVFVALTILQAANAVSLWRWKVDAGEDGIEVHQGLRPPRQVPWDRIVEVRRTLPPTIEVAGGDDLRLGAAIPRKLLQRVAEHVSAHAAGHPRPHSP